MGGPPGSTRIASTGKGVPQGVRNPRWGSMMVASRGESPA